MPENFSTRTVTVSNPQGLHARPAYVLVNTASQFQAEIEVIRDGEAMNAKSIMAILTLGAEQGVQLTLRATGTDAQRALDAIEALFVAGFGESGNAAASNESQTGE